MRLYNRGFISITLLFGAFISAMACFVSFTEYLGYLGISTQAIGMILSFDALASLVFQLLLAPYVSNGNARRWLVLGVLCYATALVLMAQAGTVWQFSLLRLVQGCGLVFIQAPLVVMLIEFIPEGRSGEAFGVFTLIRLLPYTVIPVIIDLGVQQPGQFTTVLYLAAAVSLLPVLAVFLPKGRIPAAVAHQATGLRSVVDSFRSRPVLCLQLSTLLLFCGYSSIFYYIRAYGASVDLKNPAIFFSAASAAMILIRVLLLRAFDRYDKVTMSMIGMAAAMVSYALIPQFHQEGLFLGLAVLLGAGWGVAMPLQGAVLFDISAPEKRALNQNIFLAMVMAGFFVGPLFGGVLISALGYGVFFYAMAVLTLVSVLLMQQARTPSPVHSEV
nr:MFS transporter [uncultured Desulfuromonas sp.]